MKQPEQLKDSQFISQLKNDHYVICPKEILFGFPTLTMQQKFAYLYLLQYGLFSIMNGRVDENGNPIIFASQERLAKDMDVSQPTVSRYMKALEKVGLIAIYGDHGLQNYTTVYPPSYAPMNTEPMHPCIQDIRELETEEKENTDAEASEELTPAFSLKPSKKDKGRTVKPIKRKVDDIIGDIIARTPKVKPPKAKPKNKESPAGDRRHSGTLLEHFEDTYSKKFGVKPPLTTGKDLKLLKGMITHYGYDNVVAMVDFGVGHFETFKRDKGITGKPTVGVIYGFRVYLEEKMNLLESSEKPDKPERMPNDDEESEWV